MERLLSNEKISILIVDDEKELLEMYREFFEMDGFDVSTASSALEGLQVYKNNLGIRLIISDANMGDMSGIDFLKALKSTYQTIPIFYLSTGALEHSEADSPGVAIAVSYIRRALGPPRAV